MRVLILGGTQFLGRHLAEAAHARGHEVTLFNRGNNSEGLFPEAEHLRGNRDGDLDALRGRTWDAAVDTSGYVPRTVRASAELLKDEVEHYTFVSSISVYDGWPGVSRIDETAPAGTLENPTVEEVTGETYGPLKALCEDVARVVFPGRALIVRPGLIVGPYDQTDRFTYWPVRVARGGEVLAAGRPDRAVQFIDARDLAGWILDMAERRATGTYNATGPVPPVTMEGLLAQAREVSGSDARFTWVPDAAVTAAGLQDWIEVPLWAPEDESPGLSDVNCQRAYDAGLTFRPVADTLRDTLAWASSRPQDYAMRAGIAPEREAEVLAAWHAQQE